MFERSVTASMGGAVGAQFRFEASDRASSGGAFAQGLDAVDRSARERAPRRAIERSFTARAHVPSSDFVSRRRANARRVLQALHEAYPGSLDAWTLFERAWPDVSIRDEKILGRLYTCIYRLRNLGLEGVIVHLGESYQLAGPVHLVPEP